MRIGIIGTGSMGRALGERWAATGHEVLFGSRDLAKAAAVATAFPGTARPGDFDAAAEFGDVVLHTVREVWPSKLLRTPGALHGKVVIDCNNSAILGLDIPDPQARPGLHFVPPIPSLAERLAADVPRARVVKAFSTVPATVIALDRETLRTHRVSVFLAGDDTTAKATVANLADELGFTPIDSGGLEHAGLVEGLADFLRLQIISFGRGPGATVSMNVLPEI
jgi:predicted dinucleotide-binding enzyme